MIFAVFFEDDDGFAHMREKRMSDHLEFLIKNKTQIHAAGPLIDSGDNSSAGGLWIVEADHVDEIQSLIEEDPFWPTGLRKTIKVLQWNQVFENGRVLI